MNTERAYNQNSGFIHGNWHAWHGSAGKFLLSDESREFLSMGLTQFNTVDDAINWLFLNGHKPAARALHQWNKERNK